MIENKDLGLKVAESTDEAFWQDILDKTKREILMSQRAIELNGNIVEFCDKKLKELKK